MWFMQNNKNANMYEILKKRLLAPDIWLMDIHAERIARSAQPGQFVIVRASERGERIPLTIADYDREKGTVTIVVQAVGSSTRQIVALGEGNSLSAFAGPLGQPSEFIHDDIDELRKKKILFVAGGVGAAPIFPQVKWLHENGVEADSLVGARNKDFLMLTDELRNVSGNLFLATDDGSAGFHGNVAQMMKELIEVQGRKYDLVVTIGPMIMMKFVSLTTKGWDIPTIASLNTMMIDGTGMCGACRVSVHGQTRFTCVEGPEFDAHGVDFDEAMRRQTMYRGHEQEADHKCRIGLG